MNDTHRPASEHTLADLFNLAIQNEKDAARLYSELAERFSHAPDVAAFWTGMRSDEFFHGAFLRQLLEGSSMEDLLDHPDEQMWNKAAAIHQTLGKDLLAEVANLDDAFELSHDLEFSEVNAIFTFLIRDVIPQAKRNDLALENVVAHQDKLLFFPEVFGDRAFRKDLAILPRAACVS